MTFPLPFVLATQNDGKAREIVEIFATTLDVALGAYAVDDIGYVVDAPAMLAHAVESLPVLAVAPDVTETGTTLEENARIKAQALCGALGLVAIADDTGLEVDALDGEPGVRSARFAGEDATDADNVALLLERLAGVDAPRRTGRFATVALVAWPDGRELATRGAVDGAIATARRGDAGFGYDPVFVPFEGDGRTFAEMTPDEKHAISHRGRAFRALAAALTETGE